MKFFSPAKICFLSVFVSVLAFSCSSPLVSRYYVQQQNKRNVLSAETTPDFSIPDGELPPEQELAPGQISMFSVILRDGNIAEPAGDGAVAAQLQGKLGGSDASYTGYNFSSDFFIPAKISIRGISDKFPDLHYETSGAEWKDKLIEDVHGIYKQTRAGNDFTAKDKGISSNVSNVVYRRIYGESPFKLYADARYEIYGEDGKPTGQYEPLMTRFMFYFFTGQTASPALQNCLVAVDTYSKLVFQFGKPVNFEIKFGNNVPTKWAPVDLASTGPGGKKYRFYQYDPVGYVTQDGSFHMTDTYKANLKNEIYDPVYTGKSPYVGYVGNAAGNEELIPPLTGTLAVRVKYLKNISVSDAGTDAEFTWDIRSRAYSGNAAPAWDSLEQQLTDLYYKIPKDSKVDFTSTQKEYAFTGKNGPHILELDSEIIELDDGNIVNPHDPITTKQKPVIFLNYDTEHSLWKMSGTNNTFINGEVTFDTNFTLADGEKKDFVITLPAPDNEKMELCYELYWEVEARPKLSISNPRLKNISIKDSHRSSKYQFAYTLKTAYNNEDWKPSSNSTKTVKINEEASLEGEYSWPVNKPHSGTHVVRLSAEIWEEDTMSANDVIIKHGKPVIELRYDSLTDSWSPFLKLPADFEDSDGKWKIKSVSMNTLNRNKKETLTITISAYIWESVNDDGDMELSFDVEWK